MTRTHRARVAAQMTTGLVCLAMVTGCGTRLTTAQLQSAESGSGAVANVTSEGSVASSTGGDAGGSTGASSQGARSPVTSTPGGSTGPVATTSGAGAGAPARPGGSTTGGAAEAGSGGGTAQGKAVSCAKSGPPIKLGQVGTFSGVIAASVGQSKQAMQVWAAYQNANGGVACHPIKLTQLDDQSDPTTANSNVKSLINDTKVAALVGVFSPIAMSGVRDGVKGSDVSVVGGDGVDPVWTSTPGIYGVGMGINNQVAVLAKSEAAAGRKKVAVFWCVEANSCTSAGAVATGGGPYSVTANGQTMVYKASMSITQPDYTAQCQSAKNAGATSMFIATESQSLTRFMQSCDSVGYYPQVTTCGICLGFDVSNATLQKFKVTGITPVFPYMRSDNAAEKTFLDAFKQYAPGTTPGGIAAQTWAAGMMLQRVLELLGPAAQSQEITPSLIAKGLGLVKNETLGGLIASTTYQPNQKATVPNPCGKLIYFARGTWSAASSRFDCAP